MKRINLRLLTGALVLSALGGSVTAYGQVGTPAVVKRSIEAALPLAIAPNAMGLPKENHPVRGNVRDEAGKALSGVSVMVEGSSKGTVTDNGGNYSLNDVSDKDVLVFTYVGFQTQSIGVNSRERIDITLLREEQGLNEVVVTGYTNQRKKDIIGSVAVVDVKALKSVPTGSAVQALQGQASGVNIIRAGKPGGGSLIFIRGISSFGDTQPLVLMDGVEVNPDNVSPQDIESVQVLKDAGAAAIYGVRGANGVIIITTKKGKSGAPAVNYDSYYGVQVPIQGNAFNMMNTEDFARLFKVAFPATTLFKNGIPDYIYKGPSSVGTGMEGDPAVAISKYNFDVSDPTKNYLIQKVNKTGTDWFHEVFKPAPMQQHTLSMSGGTDKANYLFSLGYLDQQGTMIETYLKRYSVRLNTGYKIGRNIRVGENAYLFTSSNPSINNLDELNPVSEIYRQMPIIPVYDIAGNFGGMFAGPDLGNATNPVADLKRTRNNIDRNWVVNGNIYAEADFLKHFTARTSYGGTVGNHNNRAFIFNQYNNMEGFANLPKLTLTQNSDVYWVWTNTLAYGNSFGKHDVRALVGSEAIEYSGDYLEGDRQGFFSTDPDYLILGNGTSAINNSSSAYINTLYSLFGRVDYAYNNRYLLGVTLRRDGSSKFGSKNRFGTFPSVSAGWRLSKEPFMSDIDWLNDLKVRASYGVLGSQNNVNAGNAFTLFNSGVTVSYYDIYGTGNSTVLGFRQSTIGNPLTSWEKDIVSNYGFDASLFKNKLSISAEYYRKAVEGLLFPQPLPATVGGAAAPTINIGDIRNTGVDLTLGYRGQVRSKLGFSVTANITTYKNMVVDIPDPGYFETGSSRIGNLVRNQEGQPVSSFFGYEVLGLFQTDAEVAAAPKQDGAAPGRFKYKDITGDGKITPDDRTFIGNPNPDFTYGLNLGLNYKNFDFSALLYGSYGNEEFNLVKWYTHFFSGFKSGKSNVLLNAWTPENPNTDIPKVEATGNFSTSNVPNSFYIENGSFLKLRSLVIGYSVQPSLLRKVGISKLRWYLQGANLFTITRYTGLDPELPGANATFGIDRGNYPNNEKNFLLGLSLSF